MTDNNTTKNRPSHAIFQVTGEDDKARWTRIGAAWTNRDGKGFTCVFDAIPMTGRTVIREMREQDETGGQQ